MNTNDSFPARPPVGGLAPEIVKKAYRRIYKYPLALADQQTIHLPAGAHLLSVQMQNGSICLWALVNTSMHNRSRTVHIIGTGHPIDDFSPTWNYIGTVQHERFVWHVFIED